MSHIRAAVHLLIASTLAVGTPRHLYGRWVTAGIFFVQGLVNLNAAAWAIIDPPTAHLMASGAIGTKILYAWSIIGTFGGTAGMVVMTSEALRDSLQNRLEELDKARASAEEALMHERLMLREQRNFLSMISHEFRTPLAIVSATIDVLGLNLETADSETPEELNRIRRAVIRLVNLVDSVMTDDWLEAGISNQPQAEINLYRMLSDLSSEQDIPLKADIPENLAVSGNAALLQVAVSNLIDNARKYGSRDGARIRCRQEEKTGVRIEVADDGPGIDAADLPRIFEKYFRSPKMQTKPGAGLGLYLVRRIVEQHRGRVEVAPNGGRGSLFTITLPLRTSAKT